MMGKLGRLAATLLDLLFPQACLGCSSNDPRAGGFCEDCEGALKRRSQLEVASGSATWVRFAPFEYTEPIKVAISRLKYQGRSEHATRLVSAYFPARTPEFCERAVLVPVPIHPSRLMERGYNQAGLLAAALSRRWQIPVDFDSLVRRVWVARQVGLTRAERQKNVESAFAIRGRKLEGRRVVLVDDVVTTGATTEACAKALETTGAQVVGVVAVARADRAAVDTGLTMPREPQVLGLP